LRGDVTISDSDSTTPTNTGKPPKPSKPNPDFSLSPHATGRWAKKIWGKIYYFGPWARPDAALNKYNKAKDDLHAGRKPRKETEGHTIK
jgi:hypothetical protein